MESLKERLLVEANWLDELAAHAFSAHGSDAALYNGIKNSANRLREASEALGVSPPAEQGRLLRLIEDKFFVAGQMDAQGHEAEKWKIGSGGTVLAMSKRLLSDARTALAELASSGVSPSGGWQAALQRFYDVTTWLLSECPTGRTDEGATQQYHDALLALTNVRADVRNGDAITHDESWWHRTRKPAPPASPSLPREGEK